MCVTWAAYGLTAGKVRHFGRLKNRLLFYTALNLGRGFSETLND
ncbi:hypothetical protein CCP3SC5AM1_260010 [Gammaproteobacteria bacterium]